MPATHVDDDSVRFTRESDDDPFTIEYRRMGEALQVTIERPQNTQRWTFRRDTPAR